MGVCVCFVSEMSYGCLCAGSSQVQRRVPQPQHGGEAPGTGAAGLQTVAIQSGEV